MADLLGAMRVEIVGDNSKLDKSIDQSQKKTEDYGKSSKKLGASLGKLFTGIGIAVVTKKLFELGKQSEKLYQAQETAEAKLQATLKATGDAAGLTKDQLLDMATGLQQITTFGDEAVIGAESLLLTFKSIGGDVFPRALSSILDVSSAMGQDLKTSTIQLGKALNDPVAGLSALTRVGIQFTDVQKDLIKGFQENGDIASAQGVILEELESQFGGVAAAAALTAEGIQIQLNNAIGDLQEAIGESISNGLSPWRKSLQTVVEQFTLLISKQNIAKDFIRDFKDGSIDATRSLEDLQITLAELNKQTEQSGRGGSQALKDQIQAVEALISAYGIQDTFLIKAAESQEALARASADEATKKKAALDLEQTVRDKLTELRAVELTESDKQIQSLQEQIDLWAQYREVPGAQELINELISRRNELMGENTEIIEENLIVSTDATDKLNALLVDQAREHGLLKDSIIEDNETVKASFEDTWQSYGTLALSTLSAIDTYASAIAERDLQRLKDSGASQEELDEKKKELEIKAAKRKKLITLFEITLSTASAIAEAIPNWPVVIATAAVGTAQTILAAATPIPTFAQGGIVAGNSFVGDKIPTLQNSGEMDIPMKEQAALWEFIKGGSNGSTGGQMIHNTVNLDGKTIIDFITKASASGKLITSARSVK